MKKLFLLTLILTSFQSANAQSLIDTARDFSHYSTHGELLELFTLLFFIKSLAILTPR